MNDFLIYYFLFETIKVYMNRLGHYESKTSMIVFTLSMKGICAH